MTKKDNTGRFSEPSAFADPGELESIDGVKPGEPGYTDLLLKQMIQQTKDQKAKDQ